MKYQRYYLINNILTKYNIAVEVCGVSAVLFVVVLVACLFVCRLRKKDEGSYSLDETKTPLY